MKKLINGLLTFLSVASMSCIVHASESEIMRVIPALGTVGTFTYSSSDLPIGWGPSGSVVTLLQAPGQRIFYCANPSGVGSSEVTILLSLSNRFGSRFCNHHHGQLILQMTVQHLINTFQTTWTQYLSTPSTSFTKFLITHSSFGPCIQVTAPSSNFSLVMAAFRKMLNDMYAATVTDAQVDAICDQLQADITAAINANTTGGQTFGSKAIHAVTMSKPKWDCSDKWIPSLQTQCGIPLGSMEGYSWPKLGAMKGTIPARESVRLCLSLIHRERDITLYIATGDNTILPLVPTEMKNFSDGQAPTYTKTYSKHYYGYVCPKGGKFSVSRTSDPDNAVGGIIYFGPITATSMLAAGMTLKLLGDKTVNTGTFVGTMNMCMMPHAGQMTVRFGSSDITGTVTTAWSTLMTNLKARYNSGANTADFSTPGFVNLIDQVYNHFLLGAYRTQMIYDNSQAASILTLTTEGHANWLMLFYGALGAADTLNQTRAKLLSDKITLLTQAAALIVSSADTTITSELDYFKF